MRNEVKSAKVLWRSGSTMFYVYILESLKNGKKYTGFSSKPPDERLKEHNTSCSKWTKGNKPFKMAYIETVETEKFAKQRERYLKSGRGRQFIDKVIPA